MVNIVKFIVIITIYWQTNIVFGLANGRMAEAAKAAEVAETATINDGPVVRHKRHLRFPYNSCFALAVVLAIPIKLPNRNVYLAYNFETNYYLPYYDRVQGLVPIPWTTIDEPGVNSGTILAYKNNIPPRERTLGDEAAEIVSESNSTSSRNATEAVAVDVKSEVLSNVIEKSGNPGSEVPLPEKVESKSRIELAGKKMTSTNNATATTSDDTTRKTNTHKTKRGILSTLLSRKKFYKILIHKLEVAGLNGDACLLRTICETSQRPLGDVNGVLGDIVHILFTPSSSRDEKLPLRYYEAEQNGQLDLCRKYDYDCPTGIYDLISLMK